MSKNKNNTDEASNKENKSDSSEELEQVRAQLARALADYDNLRKRIDKEKVDYERVVKAKIITRMLQVFDMLSEAQKHLNDDGLKIAMNTFEKILEEENVEQISVKSGMKFDEQLHEAVEIIHDANKENGEVVDLMQTGWCFKDGTVIRYAKVIVNKL